MNVTVTTYGIGILLKYIKDNHIDSPDIDALVMELGLVAPHNEQLVTTVVEIIGASKNFGAVRGFVDGKATALEPLMNQVMQIHRGADPRWVFELMVAGIQHKFVKVN